MSYSIDVNDEDIGIRHFSLRKEKAVERAVEKIRHNLNSEWKNIDSKDIDIFQWALGETWATMGFYEWEHIGFSFMSIDDIQKIVTLAKKVLSHEMLGSKVFHKIHEILTGLESPNKEEY